LNRFLFEHFPRGTAFAAGELAPDPDDLPLAEARAFSIDDVTTTEIDDAFSVRQLANGNSSVGIHIAAPALGIASGSSVDAAARERLSTVYFPGGKITMLPEPAISRYTLGEHRLPPVLSLYLEVAPDFAIVATSTLGGASPSRPTSATMRSGLVHEAAFESGSVDHPFGPELTILWRLAGALAAAGQG
jgi:exoribonuclease-2